RPKAVPPSLPVVVGDGCVVNGRECAKGRAHVDMGLGAQFPKRSLDTGILPQGLDERAHRVERGGVHLVDELLESARREPSFNPSMVIAEVELRLTDEEVVFAEPIEGSQPAFGGLQVGGELVDVRASRGDDAPAKNRSSPHGSVPIGRWNVEGARKESTVQVFTHQHRRVRRGLRAGWLVRRSASSWGPLHRNSTEFARRVRVSTARRWYKRGRTAEAFEHGEP